MNKGYEYRRAEPCTRRLRRLSAAEREPLVRRGIKPFVSSLARSCPCKHGRDFAPFVNKLGFRTVLIIVILFCLYSCMKMNDTENYQYIGELNIQYRDEYIKLFLPYKKPNKISTVFESASDGLIIDEIMVDNVIIAPHDDITAIIERSDSEIFSIGKNNEIEMLWEVRKKSGSMYDDEINKGIYFKDFNYFLSQNIPCWGLQPYSYNIPYGSNEVKLKYRIYYPNGIFGKTIYYVKFNLTWPEIRVADSNGNIKTPSEYIDLGLIRPVNNSLSIELPFIGHEPQPRINNKRWLLIYELICDGKVIRPEEVNSQENENIDFLTKKENIELGSNTTDMVWLVNDKIENGLFFYFRAEPSKSKRLPTKYNIPYGGKEIYMAYDIMFFSNVGYTIFKDRMCIKWEIDW